MNVRFKLPIRLETEFFIFNKSFFKQTNFNTRREKTSLIYLNKYSHYSLCEVKPFGSRQGLKKGIQITGSWFLLKSLLPVVPAGELFAISMTLSLNLSFGSG